MQRVRRMPTQKTPMPWAFVVGLAITLIGTALAVMSFGSVTALRLPVALGLAWGLAELGGGLSLISARGIGIAHTVAGALTLALAMLFSGLTALPGFTFAPEGLVLFLGIAAGCNAIFRSLDLVLLRPGGALTESLNALVSFGVAVIALSSWRWATPALAERLIAVVMLVGGLTLTGSAAASRGRPEPVDPTVAPPIIPALV